MADWLITNEQSKRVDGKPIRETWLVIRMGKGSLTGSQGWGHSPESGLAGFLPELDKVRG